MFRSVPNITLIWWKITIFSKINEWPIHTFEQFVFGNNEVFSLLWRNLFPLTIKH